MEEKKENIEKGTVVENSEFAEVALKPESKGKLFWNWFRSNLMQTTNGMAIGLFGTLIIGTIIDLFAKIPNFEVIASWSSVIKGLMGAGIGLGVALSKKRTGVTIVASMVAGAIGNYMFAWFNTAAFATSNQFSVYAIADPLSCYISSVICLLAIKYIMRKKTPVDLILIPLVGILCSMLYSFLLANFVHYITIGIGDLIRVSFEAIPFLMCIIISVLVGMALTAPISSVAICVAVQIGNVPLAAVAALIGCSTQMLGFAVHTAHDNKWGSVVAVGIGTSMLQFKNIVKKPIIWLPTIIVSAILGPFAMLFPMDKLVAGTTSALSVGAGMGTSGLVGPLNIFQAFDSDWVAILEVLGFAIVAPLALVFLADFIFRKAGWIKEGDFSLQNDL